MLLYDTLRKFYLLLVLKVFLQGLFLKLFGLKQVSRNFILTSTTLFMAKKTAKAKTANILLLLYSCHDASPIHDQNL